MNQEQRKKLVWKFFWKEKKKELWIFFLWVMGFYGFAGIFLTVFGICGLVGLSDLGMTVKTATILWILGIIPWVFWIVRGLYCWIKNNWEGANKEADEKIEKLKTKKKK